jgi:hypothetical protein
MRKVCGATRLSYCHYALGWRLKKLETFRNKPEYMRGEERQTQNHNHLIAQGEEVT